MPERRLSFILLSTLLTIMLGGWVLSTALNKTIGQPSETKQMIHQSGLYQVLIPSQVADIQKNNSQLANLPLNDPQIQKALAGSLDSQKIQAQGDGAIDALYGWLEGKSAKPKISIAVTPDANNLAASLGSLAAQRAAKLPTCAPGQSNPDDITSHPLDATCLPGGISPETVKGFVVGEVSTNQALSQGTTVTADDLKISNGKTVLDAFSSVPVWYQRAENLPLYTAIGAAVCIILLLVILRPVMGLRSVGKQLFVVGVTLAICAWLLAWVLEWAFNHFIPADLNATLAASLAKLSTLFHDSLRDNVIHQSAYLVIPGAVLFVFGFVLKKVLHHHPAAVTSVPAASGVTPVQTDVPKKTKAASKHRTAAKKPTSRKKKK